MEYLITRLAAIGITMLLDNDPEYLSAIYNVLPRTDQSQWDFFQGKDPGNQWKSFYTFMKQMYNAALLKRALAKSLKLTNGKVSSNPNLCGKCGGVGFKRSIAPHS